MYDLSAERAFWQLYTRQLGHRGICRPLKVNKRFQYGKIWIYWSWDLPTQGRFFIPQQGDLVLIGDDKTSCQIWKTGINSELWSCELLYPLDYLFSWAFLACAGLWEYFIFAYTCPGNKFLGMGLNPCSKTCSQCRLKVWSCLLHAFNQDSAEVRTGGQPLYQSQC